MDHLKTILDVCILSGLGLMGFIALWLTIERLMFFKQVRLEAYPTQTQLENALTRNMTALFIIYSNAPYVGLLGTVLGIMLTFYEIGLSGSLDPKSVMSGLSLVLYATALGLVVAIPTLMVYNALTRRISLMVSAYAEAKAALKAPPPEAA